MVMNKMPERRTINWTRTGKKLESLRNDNIKLRRIVCRENGKRNCNRQCEICTFETMDNRISRQELADLFNVSSDVINNWESGRTVVPLEDLFLYADISGEQLIDIIVFDEPLRR